MNLYRIRLDPYRIRIVMLVLILLFINPSAGLALSPNVISSGNTPTLNAMESYAAAAAPGNWTGSTNLGYPVTFTVSGSGTQWDQFKLTTNYVNGGCSVKLTTTVSGVGTITNDHFSYTGVTFSFSGDFTSATTASGTYAYTNHVTSCGTFSQSGTWTATILRSISGNVGVGGATLSYTDGTLKTVTSQGDGSYILSVSYSWSGTVTPTHPCYSFTPPSRNYTNVTADLTGENYTPSFNNAPVCAVTVGVFRPSNGLLYLKNSNTTGFADVAINYGVGGDYPVVGDWDGNGTATIGVYRNGTFYLRNSNTVGFADIVFPFGQPGDQPIAGDWNHDGTTTIGVYRSSTATFYLRNSNSSGNADVSFVLGNPGDVGIAGDWNNDGFDTTGVFRPSSGVIFLKNANTTGIADISLNYGIPGDSPVIGDWDNNGTDTIGVYRNGTFYLRNSNTVGFADIVFALGIPGDMPIAGNWDGLP